MSAVTLVGCGGSKRPAAAPAADLYTSTLFRKSRAWAETQPGTWYIVSALHGLLHPAALVEPYDVVLGGRKGPPIHPWAIGVVAALRQAEPTMTHLTILAGHVYIGPLRWHLRDTDVAVADPLHGLGIGQRLAWLTVNTTGRTA